MPKIRYIPMPAFKPHSLDLIDNAVRIVAEYQAAGYTMTLRQLFYRFVVANLIPNEQRAYTNLGELIKKARLAGLIDWEAIEDRTRSLRENSHWRDPASIVAACIDSYAIDKWADQPKRPEVWIEKDALIGVIIPICEELDVAHFSCRGYVSTSEMWVAGQRIEAHRENTIQSQETIILHLGDHDPSGMHMTDDIEDRLSLFASQWVEVNRLALNMDQIRHYAPPPNPAKMSDTRAPEYVARFGSDSWELDALPPDVLVDLIRTAVLDLRDEELWGDACEKEEAGRAELLDFQSQLS